MDTDKLLRCMILKYRTCQSYRDSGRVEGPLGEMTFRTYFLRPGKFLFEWTSKDAQGRQRNHQICSDGEDAFTVIDHEIEKEKNLSLAIAGATGISQGVAHTVSTLLMPDIEAAIKSKTLANSGPFVGGQAETISGHACFRISSKTDTGTEELWIRQEDYALIQHVTEYTSTPEHDEKTLAAVANVDKTLATELMKVLPDLQRHSVTTVCYQSILFDQPIAPNTFSATKH